jgi:hypothetical protein
LTYPLIRAKVVTQTHGGELWQTIVSLTGQEGIAGLYTGIWIMSYKTVLFNSLMMALKDKLAALELQRKKLFSRRMSVIAADGPWRRHVRVVQRNGETPWEAAARGASVAYLDGTWSFLHPAQQHVLNQAQALQIILWLAYIMTTATTRQSEAYQLKAIAFAARGCSHILQLLPFLKARLGLLVPI